MINTGASVAACLAATLGFAGPASADGDDAGTNGPDIVEVLNGVAASSTDPAVQVLEDVAQVPVDSSGGVLIAADVEDVDVEVPVDPVDGIDLADETHDVSISLPFAAQADEGAEVANGVVAYDNNNGSITVPTVKDDGTIQVATIIEGPDAPTSYSYELDLGGYARPAVLDNGGILFMDSSGSFVLGVAPPWALDANGASVPTHYELTNGRVTQVVEHRTSQVAYPVVADPILGIDLFSKTKRTNSSKGSTVSATLSWLGQALVRSLTAAPILPGVAGTGLSLMVGAGWSELAKKQPAVATTAMYNQYVCHVTYGWTLKLSDTWDLESWRKSATNPVTWVNTKCNW
jgi:hypothetical protein